MKPIFRPKPGQVDYTHVRWAPVINCVLKHGDKILVVRRSADLKFYPGYCPAHIPSEARLNVRDPVLPQSALEDFKIG